MSVGQWHLIMPFRLLKHLELIESPSPAPFRLSVDSYSFPSLFTCSNLPALPLHISPLIRSSSAFHILSSLFAPPAPWCLPISVFIVSSAMHICITSVMHLHVWMDCIERLMRGCSWASSAQARAPAVEPQLRSSHRLSGRSCIKPLRYVSGLFAPRDSSRSTVS